LNFGVRTFNIYIIYTTYIYIYVIATAFGAIVIAYLSPV